MPRAQVARRDLQAIGGRPDTGSEITGVTESPDGKMLFVDIQHPGENTGRASAIKSTVALSPTALRGPFESNWPGNDSGVPAYGPGVAGARPRSAGGGGGQVKVAA